MKILFTSSGKGWGDKIDPRFGRADYLLLYDEDKEEFTIIDNQDVRLVAHGAGPKTAQKIFDLAPNVLVTGNGPGGNAAKFLSKMDLSIYVGATGMTIQEAYDAYKNSKLVKGG